MMLFNFFFKQNFFGHKTWRNDFGWMNFEYFFLLFRKKSITAFIGSFSNAVLRLPMPAWHCINVSGNSTIARKYLATINTCISTLRVSCGTILQFSEHYGGNVTKAFEDLARFKCTIVANSAITPECRSTARTKWCDVLVKSVCFLVVSKQLSS